VRTTDAASGEIRNPKADYSSFNPRLGVIYSLGDSNELFASVSRLYEAPTTFELEDEARGNDATLDAMHGEVLEIGMRGDHGTEGSARWHWDVSAYYARLDDEILSVDDPAAPGNSLTANIDQTIHAGLEALVGASFAAGPGRIEPLLSITLNEFSFDSDANYGDNALPAAPRYALRGEILYRQGGLYAGPTLDFVGKRFADFANTYQLDSHALVGVRGRLFGRQLGVVCRAAQPHRRRLRRDRERAQPGGAGRARPVSGRAPLGLRRSAFQVLTRWVSGV
jgi:iron complex outermembrane receptor protein